MVCTIYIVFTHDPNIGCANSHSAHPVPPPQFQPYLHKCFGTMCKKWRIKNMSAVMN